MLLFAPEGRDGAVAMATEVAAWLEDRAQGATAVVFDPTSNGLEPDPEALRRAQLFVSLGGDGTFLRVAALAHRHGVPVLGVNFGRLGYLLEVAPAELTAVLAQGLVEGFATEDRSVLEVAISGTGARFVAINEVAVEKSKPGHMIRLATRVDGTDFASYAADGVLVATPTGSTGYNLSAGGPVLDPSLEVVIVTPVAPHLAIDRSVVLDARSIVEVEAVDPRGAVVVVDGHTVATLEQGQSISATVHPARCRMVVASRDRFVGRLKSILAPAEPA